MGGNNVNRFSASSGAFSLPSSPYTGGWGAGAGGQYPTQANFSASSSNSIYSGATVVPLSYTAQYLIKYWEL